MLNYLFSSRLLTVNSADEFYTLMGDLTQEMLQGNMLDADSMIKVCYLLKKYNKSYTCKNCCNDPKN